MNRRIHLTLKRAFDIIVPLAVLTLLSPLMALISPGDQAQYYVATYFDRQEQAERLEAVLTALVSEGK